MAKWQNGKKSESRKAKSEKRTAQTVFPLFLKHFN
jgi:hypothetical protein